MTVWLLALSRRLTAVQRIKLAAEWVFQLVDVRWRTLLVKYFEDIKSATAMLLTNATRRARITLPTQEQAVAAGVRLECLLVNGQYAYVATKNLVLLKFQHTSPRGYTAPVFSGHHHLRKRFQDHWRLLTCSTWSLRRSSGGRSGIVEAPHLLSWLSGRRLWPGTDLARQSTSKLPLDVVMKGFPRVEHRGKESREQSTAYY